LEIRSAAILTDLRYSGKPIDVRSAKILYSKRRKSALGKPKDSIAASGTMQEPFGSSRQNKPKGWVFWVTLKT
jgi:hypothetical protein